MIFLQKQTEKKELVTRPVDKQDGFPAADVNPGAAYLANKTFESLNEMFESSQTIQNWLTNCSNVISGESPVCSTALKDV